MAQTTGKPAYPGAGVVTALILLASMALSPSALAETAHKLTIGGTGSAMASMQLLADAFVKSHPDYSVQVLPSLGSGGGIQAVAQGKIDIAVSARALKEKEQAKPISATEYARTPIVFVTHQDTAATNVTIDQLPHFYSGRADWPDGTRMRLIMRPVGEADIDLLRGISGEMKAAIDSATARHELFVAMDDQANAEALESTPGSFGLSTLAQVTSEKRKVKLLSLDGVAGTVETMKAGRYPYSKSLYTVTNREASAEVRNFIDFMMSPAGRELLIEAGHQVDLASGS